MKKENKSAKTNRNFDNLVSKLSADEILDIKELSYVRGGDGNGSEPVPIPPPPPTGN
jgi:hypothetical protein